MYARHHLELITTDAEHQKSWESEVAFCPTIQCEVVSSSITTRAGDSVPSGVISLRVAPDDLKKLLSYVEKLGKIARHTTDREDKTTAVVDTEAKIKNLTGFRDNLRAMLARPSATVSHDAGKSSIVSVRPYCSAMMAKSHGCNSSVWPCLN